MQIRITRPCVVDGAPRKRNEMLDVSESTARYLIGICKAEAIMDAPARAARETISNNDE